MSEAPGVIGFVAGPFGLRLWNRDDDDGTVPTFQYTRSDIAEREIAELRAERDSARNDEWLAAISAVQYMEANWFQDCRSEVERSALQSAAEEIISELRRSGPTEYLDLKWKDAKAAVAAESRAEAAECQLATLSAQPQPAQADGWRVVPEGEMVALDGCPEGLFSFGGYLGFMTEYSTVTSDKFLQRDAYVVASGEYFWGGASTARDRARLLVQPLSALPAAPTPAPAEGR